MSTETKTFTPDETHQIYLLVKKYDSFNQSIKDLETNIQALLKQQENILADLSETRKAEEEFFISMSDSKGLHVSELKKMAQTSIMEKVIADRS